MPLRLVIAHAEFKREDLEKFNLDEPLFEAPKIEFLVYMISNGRCVLSVTGQPDLFTVSLRGCLDEAGVRYGKNVRQVLRDSYDECNTDQHRDRVKDILNYITDYTPDNHMHRGEYNAHR